MVGAKVYDRFVALLEERDRLRTKGVPLPHPAVRTRSRAAGASARRSRGRAGVSTSSPAGRRSGGGQSLSGSSSATALVGMEPRMRSYLSSSARHHDACTSSGSAPHSAHVPSTLSKIASGCALPRSADGVPFSRELLVTPGPHLASRPLRPDRTGHVDRPSSVVVAGDGPALAQVRRHRRQAGASFRWRGRLAGCVRAPPRPEAHPPECTGRCARRWHNLYADRHARVRPAGDGGPVPPGPRRCARGACRRSRAPSASASASRPSGLRGLRHDRRRRGRAGRRDLDAAHRPAAPSRTAAADAGLSRLRDGRPGSAAVVHAGVLHAEHLGRLAAHLGDLADAEAWLPRARAPVRRQRGSPRRRRARAGGPGRPR